MILCPMDLTIVDNCSRSSPVLEGRISNVWRDVSQVLDRVLDEGQSPQSIRLTRRGAGPSSNLAARSSP